MPNNPETKQGLREPPLLNDKEADCAVTDAEMARYSGWDEVQRARQREADIKWMKEHCYLKAERELPEIFSIPSPSDDAFRLGAKIQADKMLKEVNGVAYRACREFKS